NEFIKNDWLFKVIVYGHILDYRFIERLKSYTTIDDVIKNNNIIESRGIQVGNRKDYCSYIGMQFVDTRTDKIKKHSDLNRFYIKYRKDSKWDEEYVERAREPELFKAPI